MSGRTRVTSLALLATLLALMAAPIASVSAAQANWTVMVYMSGDNNLEDYIVKDLELELAALGSNANVQVTALADRGPGYDKSRGDWQTTKLYHPTQGTIADAAGAVADWGERNMGDPDTLADFVEWSKATYPADHYALYFWGHGWGWHPGWTMEDATSADGLDPDEVKSVFTRLGYIDVVGYDACNMAQIEIMSLWSGHATALAASQEFVNMDGIEYDQIISKLRANPTMTADQVAIASSSSAIFEKTFGSMAVDSRYTALKNAVNDWSVALKSALPAQRTAITRGFQNAKSFWQAPTDKDLYDLAKQVNAQVTDAALKAKGTAVMNAVNAVVLQKQHIGKAYDMVGGITITGITRPVEKNADWTYYRAKLDFALTTGWDEFEDLLAQWRSVRRPRQRCSPPSTGSRLEARGEARRRLAVTMTADPESSEPLRRPGAGRARPAGSALRRSTGSPHRGCPGGSGGSSGARARASAPAGASCRSRPRVRRPARRGHAAGARAGPGSPRRRPGRGSTCPSPWTASG